MKKTQKNIHLEVVRGIAAFLVVLGHLIIKTPEIAHRKNHLTNLVGNWATESVLIFFVLSGIVIHSSVEAKHKSSKNFLLDRIVRINPILFVAVMISVVLEIYLFNGMPSVKMIIGNLIPISTMQGYMVDVFWNSNPVIWSLSFEMFFYFAFAIFVIKRNKISNGNILIWFILGIFSTFFYFNPISKNVIVNYIILMLAYSPVWIIGFYIWGYRNKFNTNFIIAMISLCCLPIVSRAHFTDNYYDPIRNILFALCSIPFFLFLIQDRKERKAFGFVEKYLSVFLISTTYLVSSLFIYNDSSYPLFSRILYILLPTSIIFIVLFKRLIQRFYSFFILKPFKYIGSLSYSIYLIHNPILVILATFTTAPLMIKIPLFLIVTYSASYFLEKKYQPIFNGLLLKRKAIKN
ncbi:acyltransferase family protein [Pedobacter fastidiosus]|uniref:Acyltransferase n=1 Tax=Pedobacter fastidiosus TaxID=2765361 RepID=A0ABR7KVL5_9SPHI|nr:acyltransferase [Pedobacter fastidiosus]MBC6112155.1 acyltransferase [Pedobacter fastidiosus]